MARLVRHDATGPLEFSPQKPKVWLCQCGLSQNLPQCDGSHKKTAAETPGELPVYDKTRTKVIDKRKDE